MTTILPVDVRQEQIELKCDWPLTKDSVVVIAGAYNGTVAGEYAAKYDCNLYLYEPQKWAFDLLMNRFKDNPKVRIFNYGLGVETGPFRVREFGTNGCSFMDVTPESRQLGECSLIDVYTAFKQAEIRNIDLFLCNMEGYEHKLLPYMSAKKMIRRIKFMFCQIHGGDPEVLKAIMEKTHDGTYALPGSWALWERKAR